MYQNSKIKETFIYEKNIFVFRINEESFWRNYFYRVSLTKQSTQLTALANETDENKSISNPPRRISDLLENTSDINHEFVSEDYDTSAINMDDIRRELEQLSVIKKSSGKAFLSFFFYKNKFFL